MSAPTTIAHYRITGKLGEGGMGAVYRASDTKLNREVAIKVLPDALANDPDYLARFTREAQVLASLNHPNIAIIHGVEERALVMELVQGQTLEERIAAGPIPLDEALGIARQIAEALEAAHEKGVIHRDLKPANVKITPEGVVKVLDFGLAKAPEPTAPISASSPTLTMRATQAGIILGTPGYMAPEQAAGKPVDRRADIWSFGVVLYELLTGKTLFHGETISHTLASVPKDPISFDIPQAPPTIRRLLARCLDRDAKQRLRDIGEARIAIRDYMANPVGESAPRASEPAQARRGVLPWAIAAVAIITAAAGWWHATRSTEEVPSLKLSVLPPEKATFVRNSLPALSPDGKRLAFAAMLEGKTQLWIRDLNALVARPLAGTEGASFPFWSPDSRFVAFFAEGKLKKVDVAGGAPLTVCDASSARGGAWNQNDVIIFTPTFAAPLFRVPAAGGATAPLTRFDEAAGEVSHRFPWFLPDGRHYLFTAQNREPENSVIYVGGLESKVRRRIITAASNAVNSPPGFLLFVRDHNLMAQSFDASGFTVTGDPFPIVEQVDYVAGSIQGQFAGSRTGILAYNGGGVALNGQLTWFDRGGRPSGTVGRPGAMQAPAISPDGDTVAVDRLDPRAGIYDIWSHDLAHGTDSRLTFDPKSARAPVWSPDGSRILFTSFRTGKWGLYQKPATGSGKEESLFDQTPGTTLPTDWSRDGRFAIFSTVGPKTRDIWVLPFTGDRKPFPFLQTPFAENYGKLSPDGRWLAYESFETGSYEVYVQSFPGKEGKWQVSSKGGGRPVWSRDGKELFYLSPDDTLMAVDVRSGARFEYGVPKPLFKARTPVTAQFDVSRDGKRFLIVAQEQTSATLPMTVMVNWQAGLKK